MDELLQELWKVFEKRQGQVNFEILYKAIQKHRKIYGIESKYTSFEIIKYFNKQRKIPRRIKQMARAKRDKRKLRNLKKRRKNYEITRSNTI